MRLLFIFICVLNLLLAIVNIANGNTEVAMVNTIAFIFPLTVLIIT
jgi:hypothetical protein